MCFLNNLKFKIQNLKLESGQAMILVTIMIGGIFLIVTSVAGLLILYQLQQSTDFGNSTIAVYAADAALEKGIYHYYFDDLSTICNQQFPCRIVMDGPYFINQASSSVELNIERSTTTITSTGKDMGQRTVRLLQRTFSITP